METTRCRSWIDWYKLARETLEYAHDEAVVYANVRYVEELNRGRRRRRIEAKQRGLRLR